MNPYAKHLGDRDPLDVLDATFLKLTELSPRLNPDLMNASYETGKWSLARILSHLLHVELMFGTRLRQALTSENYTVQPFDQDLWIDREPVNDGFTELRALLALRQWNLALWRSLSNTDLQHTFNHPELGPMSIRNLLELTAGHDLNHLSQIETIAGR